MGQGVKTVCCGTSHTLALTETMEVPDIVENIEVIGSLLFIAFCEGDEGAERFAVPMFLSRFCPGATAAGGSSAMVTK